MNRPTANEYQIALRIVKKIDPLKNDAISDSLVRIRLNKIFNSDRNIIIHYTHDARLVTYKKHIHQLLDQIFVDTPVKTTKLIVGNCNSRNAIKILIRRRPHTGVSRWGVVGGVTPPQSLEILFFLLDGLWTFLKSFRNILQSFQKFLIIL